MANSIQIDFSFSRSSSNLLPCSPTSTQIYKLIIFSQKMSTTNLHQYVQHTGSNTSIRRRLVRTSEQARKQNGKNSTTQSFRSGIKPKFQRLLQQDKIQIIMNADSFSKAHLCYTTHVIDMEQQLNSAKKALNTMIMKRRNKQNNIIKLKNQLSKLQRYIETLQFQRQVNQNKLIQIQGKFGTKRGNLQQKVWQQKSYKYMKGRLYHHQQYLKQQHSSIDGTIRQAQSQIHYLEQNILSINSQNEKLTTNLSRARCISREQMRQKNELINLLNEEIMQKDLINNLKQQNIIRQTQIQELIPSVIQKQELFKYMQIYFTHKLFHQIIKCKCVNIMEKYKDIQNAYMVIKSNTNIVDIGKILIRMETQDQQYQNLLDKVGQLEKQVKDIEKNILLSGERQHRILSMDGDGKLSERQINYHGLYRDEYQVLVRKKQKLIQRKKMDEILKKKIMSWVNEYSRIHEIKIKVGNQQEFFMQLEKLKNNIQKKIQGKKQKQKY